MPPLFARTLLLAATAMTSCAFSFAARAQTSAEAPADQSEARLSTLERQIRSLEAELQHVKRDMAVHNQQVKALEQQAARSHAAAASHDTVLRPYQAIPPGYALVPASPGAAPGTVELAQVAAPEEPKLPMGTFRVGNVEVTLGGFVESAAIWRSRNQVADIASNFNTGIPLPNSPNYHQSETRFSARQSRLSGLVTARPDPNTTLTAYVETDFLGAAPTANSVESDSYNLRMRQFYAAYARSDLDLYALGGQTWSLLTLQKKGLGFATPNVAYPETIDAQYVPGFSWARQPQFRIAKMFDRDLFGVALSVENPQTNYYTGPNGLAPAALGTITIASPGGAGYAPTNSYSADVAPDIIAKVAFDPGPVHVEAYGVARFMHDRVSQLGSGVSDTTTGGGGGAGVYIHVIPDVLDFQGSVLAGDGIGRYGSAQLPDAVVGRDGAPVPLPETEALVGLIAHPVPALELYGYIGTEQVSRQFFSGAVKGKTEGFGYGSPIYDNASCNIELGATAMCVANTSGVTQGTLGEWWNFIHNSYGTMRLGVQYSYTHRTIFQGIGPTPKTDDNMLFFSFRYYPFQ
jgi:multidrug efflux pump subunit AcrA (membrane-fusion protein)